MVKVRIKNLKIKTIIGVHRHERKKRQLLNIDIELEYNAEQAIHSDDVHSVVNYEKICTILIEKVNNSQFYLIESLAEYILGIIMEDLRIRKGMVRVKKPNAIAKAKSVQVELYKTR